MSILVATLFLVHTALAVDFEFLYLCEYFSALYCVLLWERYVFYSRLANLTYMYHDARFRECEKNPSLLYLICSLLLAGESTKSILVHFVLNLRFKTIFTAASCCY
jgi:hypothetical protein